MSRIARHFPALFILSLSCGVALSAKPAAAATVWCTAHAPYGNYQAYLFRTGDRLPTQVSGVFRISDGGRTVSFSGVVGGYWFIRVVNVDEFNGIRGQTHDARVGSYYSLPTYLGDCNVP